MKPFTKIEIGIIESNRRTRAIRNAKIEAWLDGHIQSRVILHHINFVWGKSN